LKPAALRLLADENIHPEVISYLRSTGLDVRDIREAGLAGAPDVQILRRALEEGRVVLTHDSDFGALAVAAGETIVGIIYLRPGHILPEFTSATLAALFDLDMDLVAPFILVLHRSGGRLRIRLRRL
jgi:predicted nuclease of predicted toxin-antitoxin system